MLGIQKTDNVCGGDARVANSRIPVWALEHARRLGMSEVEILHNYPSLTQADLRNAWIYAKAHSAEIEEAIRSNERA